MPRFKTLSDVIKHSIDTQVPKIEFADGSELNIKIGKVPLNQDDNYKFRNKSFTWGFSTWGIET
ncbi:MAG: hypothetical protein RLZZ196_2213, partial [Bacteroidota bacterium]